MDNFNDVIVYFVEDKIVDVAFINQTLEKNNMILLIPKNQPVLGGDPV